MYIIHVEMNPMGMAHHGPPKGRIGHGRTDVLWAWTLFPFQNHFISQSKRDRPTLGTTQALGQTLPWWLEVIESSIIFIHELIHNRSFQVPSHNIVQLI
jgi:hypothetical protein